MKSSGSSFFDAATGNETSMEARDRVLLYTRGAELPPLVGVDAALESLTRVAGKHGDGGLAGAMAELETVLAERGEWNIAWKAQKEGTSPLRFAPPVRRRRMLAEELDITPLRSFLKRWWKKKRASPEQEKAVAHGFDQGDSGQNDMPILVSSSDSEIPIGSQDLPASIESATLASSAYRGEKEPKEDAWLRAGHKRRLLLLALILIPSLAAGSVMNSLLPVSGLASLRACIVILFIILFAWISLGFWSSLAGALVMFRGRDRFAMSADLDESDCLPPDARTALLFPVYNENAHAVAAGIRTVLQGLRSEGVDRYFDIFILSDSTSPDAWVLEEEAWHRLCKEENAFGSVFYRRRKTNLKRKSGNIADFCRRWGGEYRYMIVFDADSLMSAPTLCRMVRIMERHPSVGILQTPPKAIKSRSLISRAQQFANHLYGPMFAAGLNYWQLNNAQYWGHNAIIRVEPFMRHCQLPSLPGKAPLGGDIMSHDFVESALMRRAGYGVWLAYDLEGSFEQTPPSLIDELVRDRRWCQGNLQHSRLVFTRGFFPTHRALFVNGILSYGSALLWLFFLLASSAQALAELFIVPDYFPVEPSLFPSWPEYFPTWALGLLSSTLALLFLPKLIAVFLLAIKGGSRAFGGLPAMVFSLLAEVVISTVLAPVRMLFHSWFIMSAFLGRSSGWNAQNRDDRGTSWSDAIRFHWWGTLLGAFWGWLMYTANPGFFLWMSPIVLGLICSIPLSVLTSRLSFGEGARRLKLFLTPVDVDPPAELLALEANLADRGDDEPFFMARNKGFCRAVVIPVVFALHRSLLHRRAVDPHEKRSVLRETVSRAIARGPEVLSRDEKLAVLADPAALTDLHRGVWASAREEASRWGLCRSADENGT